MKKLITAVAAAVLMMFSVVPAFAASVNSPVATTPAHTPTNSGSPVSPKTGMDDSILYAILGASALACGTAAVALVKTSKK
ncbi:MAG TPA: hypothetical protein DEO32_05130 [Ruminococcaceae bacterium]|nr:hypothetical protein [Oscillospiraceae bacterium]